MAQALKFEEKIKKLESIVTELENGDIEIEESLEKYTEAMKLAKECSDSLTKVSEKVNKILLENGQLEDFNIEEK